MTKIKMERERERRDQEYLKMQVFMQKYNTTRNPSALKYNFTTTTATTTAK
jgi:hypothetical protein